MSTGGLVTLNGSNLCTECGNILGVFITIPEIWNMEYVASCQLYSQVFNDTGFICKIW